LVAQYGELVMDTLCWDASYAIALALHERYQDINFEGVSLEMIFRWTLDLPNFEDDDDLANDEILAAIYQEWLELVLI
jgi:FeS assembly protein IscX